jgi:hypothetical protein
LLTVNHANLCGYPQSYNNQRARRFRRHCWS